MHSTPRQDGQHIIIPAAGHPAESSLDSTDSALENTLASAGIGMWAWLPAERLFVISKSLRRLMGIGRHAVLDLQDMVAVEDRSSLVLALAGLEAGKGIDGMTCRTINACSAMAGFILSSASGIAGSGKEHAGILQILTSNRMPHDHNPQDGTATQMFGTAFHASSDAMAIIDSASGRITAINNAFTHILGHAQEELLWNHIRDLGLTTDGKIFQSTELAVSRGESVRNIELVVRRRNGEQRTIAFSVDPMTLGGSPSALLTIRDIHEIKAAEAKIRTLAYHDSLTGLPNRSMLPELIRERVSMHQRHGLVGAVLFIDLDRFKDINDTLGHAAGDMLLKIIAARLEASVRAEDAVARLGGDEFIVVLTGIKGHAPQARQHINATAHKLLKIISESMVLDDHEVQVTPSIGVAVFPEHGDAPNDLIKHADIALYRSKDAGRNTVSFFAEDMLKALNDQVKMERELRMAIDRSELCAFYQPQVDAKGVVVGAEALVRWRKPDGRFISAFEFIPALESAGLISQVSWAVLTEACAATAQMLTDGVIDTSFTMSVNVCPLQFDNPSFTERVLMALARCRLPGHMLNLEITESMMIANPETAIRKMNSLKESGVTFAIDDFGTGYSSLAYVKRLPVSALKIDRTFVKEAITSRSDASIIAAIAALGKSLGLEVIAEGVETEAQRELLMSQGCHVFQGYLYSPALAISDLVEVIQSRKSVAA